MLTIYGAPLSIHTRKVIVTALEKNLEKRYAPAAVVPADAVSYARALWFEEYADGSVAPLVAALFREKILGPMQGRKPEPAVLDDLVTQLLPCLDYLEESLGDDYLAGQAFSIADIAVASNLVMYHYLDYGLDAARHGQLGAHLRRMLARPSFEKAIAAERPFVEKLGLDGSTLSHIGRES